MIRGRELQGMTATTGLIPIVAPSLAEPVLVEVAVPTIGMMLIAAMVTLCTPQGTEVFIMAIDDITIKHGIY